MNLEVLDAMGRLGNPVPWYRTDLLRMVTAAASKSTSLASPPTKKQIETAVETYESLVRQVDYDGWVRVVVHGPPATRKQIRRAVQAEAMRLRRTRAHIPYLPVEMNFRATKAARTTRRVAIDSLDPAQIAADVRHVDANWADDTDTAWLITAAACPGLDGLVSHGLDAIACPVGFERVADWRRFRYAIASQIRISGPLDHRVWSLRSPEW